ncbi:MAG TPA: hypothetical protein VD907_01850 [Verrucomicrobiae bacterium]|nr:hypothetical protein [Verrucomicrobiae bacterium]
MAETNGILWLKLDTHSKKVLLEACPQRYEQLFCDHVTLRYDVPRAEVEGWIGTQTEVVAYEHCWNSNTQAVRVDSLELPNQYGVPHVTISTTAGTKPFTSVTMLQTGNCQRQPIDRLVLSGVIQFVSLES